jgi:formylglycine-generating enzyme required for sulfatase activity
MTARQTRRSLGDSVGWEKAVFGGRLHCNGCGSPRDDRQTSPVGSFKPNAFGLYDMAGNVWQWLEDCFHRDYDKAPKDGSAQKSGDCQTRVVRVVATNSERARTREAAGAWALYSQYFKAFHRAAVPLFGTR